MQQPPSWTAHAWMRYYERYPEDLLTEEQLWSVKGLINYNFAYKFKNDHFKNRPDKTVVVLFKIKSWPCSLKVLYDYSTGIIVTVLPKKKRKDERGPPLFLIRFDLPEGC